MTMVGEPERPEVQKNMEDVSSQVSTVTEKFEERARTLEAALEKAVHFQDELMVRHLYTVPLKMLLLLFLLIPWSNMICDMEPYRCYVKVLFQKILFFIDNEVEKF